MKKLVLNLMMFEKVKPWVSRFLKLLIAAVLLYWLSTQIEYSDALRALVECNPYYAAAALILLTLTRYVSSVQSSLLFKHQGFVLSPGNVFRVTMVASFFGLLLPAEWGVGVVKWYRLKNNSGDGVAALMNMLALKIISLSVIAFTGILALAYDNPFSFLHLHKILIVFVLAFVVITLVVRRFSIRFGAVANLPRSLLSSLVLFSFLGQILVCLVLFAVAKSLDIPLTLERAVWLNAVVSFIQLLPISPGGLGVRESVLFLLFTKMNLDGSSAVAYGLSLFALGVVWAIPGGLIVLKETIKGRVN